MVKCLSSETGFLQFERSFHKSNVFFFSFFLHWIKTRKWWKLQNITDNVPEQEKSPGLEDIFTFQTNDSLACNRLAVRAGERL